MSKNPSCRCSSPCDDEKINNNKRIKVEEENTYSDGEEDSDDELYPPIYLGDNTEIALKCLEIYFNQTGKKFELIKVTEPVISVGITYGVIMEIVDVADGSIHKVDATLVEIPTWSVTMKFDPPPDSL